jgi:hypothetical protein
MANGHLCRGGLARIFNFFASQSELRVKLIKLWLNSLGAELFSNLFKLDFFLENYEASY